MTRLLLKPIDGTRCRDVMEPAANEVHIDFTCARAFEAMIAARRRYVPVMRSGKLAGLITIADFARLKGRAPGDTFVGAIMTPKADILTLAPETMASDAFRLLEESGYHQLPVLGADGKLEGFITRETPMGLMVWAE